MLHKTCSRCTKTKPAEEFGKNRARRDGLQTYCRECKRGAYHSDPDQKRKAAEQARRWAADNRERKAQANRRYNECNTEKRRAYNRKCLLSKYGMTPAEFDQLLAAQGNRCAICRADEPGGKGWNVDHCHTTGRVRGILCAKCNMGIGLMGDDPTILRLAVAYLESAA